MKTSSRWICGIALWGALAAGAAEPGNLKAGAARIDITPAEDAALPLGGYGGRTHGFERIRDRIYARAIVLDDGATRAAILAFDLTNIPNGVWAELAPRIEKETGIPAGNVLMAAVHDHSAPMLRGGYRPTGPETAVYTGKVEEAAVKAVRQARAALQPARAGAGAGAAYLNVNRREWKPESGDWVLGKRLEGPADRTVAVVRFEDVEGRPIALLVNYPVHAVVMGPENYQLTGDVAGATSRFIEQYYNSGGQYARPGRVRPDAGVNLQPRAGMAAPGREVVALWTSGAAGDLNPIGLARGTDFTLVDAFGQVLGEEAIRVAGSIKTSHRARVWTGQKEITCPGKKTVPGPGKEVRFEDAEPATARLSLVAVNDIAMAGVSGEVLNMIGQRLKKESPLPHTMMITHANGSAGYIPDDAAYDQISYEVRSTRFKKGCAEGAIVNGLLEMIGPRAVK